MYAAHFAAALAIRTTAPRAPAAALVILAFLPDLLWLGLSVTGIEIVDAGSWFDGWSHSIASILVQALVVGTLFRSQGLSVAVAVAAAGAVLSHLLLDLPMHPAALQWYPHAAAGFGDLLHGWAGGSAMLGKTAGWWTEAATVGCGLAIYLTGARRAGVGRAAAVGGAILVGSLHLAFG